MEEEKFVNDEEMSAEEKSFRTRRLLRKIFYWLCLPGLFAGSAYFLTKDGTESIPELLKALKYPEDDTNELHKVQRSISRHWITQFFITYLCRNSRMVLRNSII